MVVVDLVVTLRKGSAGHAVFSGPIPTLLDEVDGTIEGEVINKLPRFAGRESCELC